ncbi:MAG: HEAT repeat domain-containing protein [Actinobacteria bacterium]|nr:HEAT repeat domain-containing protein [Actinomycetota bacterium]
MERRDYFANDVPLGVLVKRAESNDPMERWAAVIELGEVGSEEAARALRAATEDSDEFVREAARSALKRFDVEVLTKAGLESESVTAGGRQKYQPGRIRFSSHVEAPPFVPWRTQPLPEPGKADDWLVDAAILDIVSTEGPITGYRLFRLYGTGVNPNQPSKLSQSKLQSAVERVVGRGLIARSDDYTSDYLFRWILHRMGTEEVVVRQRGSRELRDIPVNEVHQVLLELTRSLDGALKIDSNRAFQMIFDFYKIERREWHVVGKLLTEDWLPLLTAR